MNKIDKKKKEIVNHYNAIILNLGISFLTSVIGGLVSAILIAVIFGQTPSEIYRSFSTPLILWGLFLIVLFFIFFFIFWLIFVFVPRSKELKSLGDKKEQMKTRKNSIGFWGRVLVITSIILTLFFYTKEILILH